MSSLRDVNLLNFVSSGHFSPLYEVPLDHYEHFNQLHAHFVAGLVQKIVIKCCGHDCCKPAIG